MAYRPEIVFHRTDAGDATLRTNRAIDPWLRHVLRLVDGQRTVMALKKTVPPNTIDKILDQLEEQGLIRSPIMDKMVRTQELPTLELDMLKQMELQRQAEREKRELKQRAAGAQMSREARQLTASVASQQPRPTPPPPSAPIPPVAIEQAPAPITAPAAQRSRLQIAREELAEKLVGIVGEPGESLARYMLDAGSFDELRVLTIEGDRILRSSGHVAGAQEFADLFYVHWVSAAAE